LRLLKKEAHNGINKTDYRFIISQASLLNNVYYNFLFSQAGRR